MTALQQPFHSLLLHSHSIAPMDFTGGIYTAFFTEGNRTATVKLIANEGVVENGPETFKAVLQQGNGVAIGTNDTAFITIIDTTG